MTKTIKAKETKYKQKSREGQLDDVIKNCSENETNF